MDHAGKQASTEPGGLPGYGSGPAAPPPRRRSPLLLLLLGLIGLVFLALAALVVTGLGAEAPASAYQNDDYQVPPPDLTPPPLPFPESNAEAEQLLVDNPFYAQTTPAPVRCR